MVQNTKRVIHNHHIEYYLQCPYKYRLKMEGWQLREQNENMLIGKAVHAALASWCVNGNDTEAYKQAFLVLGNRDELTETVFAVLSGYFEKYKDDNLVVAVPETEFSVPINGLEGVEYGVKIDAIATFEGKFWIKESKTTGKAPSNFWQMYNFNRQTLGYVWAARQFFDMPIAGYVIDTCFKPTYKVPEPRYERRYFEPSEKEIELWLNETKAIIGYILRTEKEWSWPRSGQCWIGSSVCEFRPHCENAMLRSVLTSTHYNVNEESGKPDA